MSVRVYLARVEVETTKLTDEEVFDLLNWELDHQTDREMPADVSAMKVLRVVDVTPPRGVD